MNWPIAFVLVGAELLAGLIVLVAVGLHFRRK